MNTATNLSLIHIFIWPPNCRYVGVILNAKFELPGVTPRATRAAADAQISDLSPQPFSESLLAASKTIVEVGALRSESSRAARQQKVSSGDGKAPESIPASLSLIHI